MSRIKGGPESGDPSPAGLPEIPAWLPGDLQNAVISALGGVLDRSQLQILISGQPWEIRAKTRSAVDRLFEGPEPTPPNIATGINPVNQRMERVERIWREKLSGESGAEDVLVPTIVLENPPQAIQAVGRNLEALVPDGQIATALIAQALMPAPETQITIGSPRDVLAPEILNPLYRKGKSKALKAAISQLPGQKPRQKAFDLILGRCLADLKEGEIGRVHVSRVIRGLMGADDSVDEISGNIGERPKAHAMVKAALEKVRDDDLYGRIIRSLPVAVIEELDCGHDCLTPRQVASMIKSVANGQYRQGVSRGETGDRRRQDPRPRDGFRIAKDSLRDEIEIREEVREWERLAGLVGVAVARGEPFATDVIHKLLNTRGGSDYAVGPIINLAENGDRRALKLLGLDPITQHIAAKISMELDSGIIMRTDEEELEEVPRGRMSDFF